MRDSRGFSLIEILISAIVVAVAGMAAVAYTTSAAQHTDWAGHRVLARQKALSLIAELRAFVEGGEGEVAADLDGFDDGLSYNPSLSIAPDINDPGAFVKPAHPLSGNVRDRGEWVWFRQLSIRPVAGSMSRDLRVCTARVFRRYQGEPLPGERMAEVSTVIRTVGAAYPSTQVFDLYLLALENVPGWWVHMGAMKPFVEGTIRDLEVRNPGLKFRTHWITTLGYGRDAEYAPYTNDERVSTDNTPWAYVYPGRMPVGEATTRYYVPKNMRARVNIDGELIPTFVHDVELQEPYTDENGNGKRDPGEPFVDANGDLRWTVGNEAPYALADMQNHCMRHPEADALFDARMAVQLDEYQTPSWRLLLDRMVADPDSFHNAILVNLHGELLPMPPTRNVSDAASDPVLRQGWRVVTHPERLRPKRVPGDNVNSDAPVFRVYAYKTAFPAGDEVLMTQQEPFFDADKDGVYDAGEGFPDWNGNGVWDAGIPMTVAFRAADLSTNPNGVTNPSILVHKLAGGIDADNDGASDTYDAGFVPAVSYPEAFSDANGDGIRQVSEVYFDLNGDGTRDPLEPYMERDGDGVYGNFNELLVDANGNGRFDAARPAEPFQDANANNRWDGAEPYWDRNNNGQWDGPTIVPAPVWQPWDPLLFGDTLSEDGYVAKYGEPFLDVDGDQNWDDAEIFPDMNQNGVCDGGIARGEMWYQVRYEAATNQTVLTLHGTPLETPRLNNTGLSDAWRLYDLEYVPCPTPDTAAGSDRFARHLAFDGDVPKNTARWRITLPLASVRSAYESTAGAVDGDQVDRLIAVDTRVGSDLTTGVMWPVRNKPQNRSTTYAWFADSPGDVPFSERFQMRGDPRLSPYADTDRYGDTAPNGYNWYWDDMSDGNGNQQGQWLAFDGGRIRDGWLGRNDHDIGRMFQWLRTAISGSEAIYTTLTGWSYYYLSCGGDVGYDSANGYANSIPMDGMPFGLSSDVYENTITTSGGTASIIGSRKFVRGNAGSTAGIRSGGHWWSKPFLGELFPDEAYVNQWRPWGNLRAAASGSGADYRLVRRSEVPAAQQPLGTTLLNMISRTQYEGCTSLFTIGTSGSTFHHTAYSNQTGTLIDGGLELATNYGYAIPATASISRPFGLALSGSGGVGDEFNYTTEFPRYSAQIVSTFYNHQSGDIGSALVRHQQPGANPRGGYIVVNGLDRTIENGTSFIARYSILSLVHSFFHAGVPGGANRVRQLPRVEIVSPTIITEIGDPASITINWTAEWKRWDGRKYTGSYPDNFAEDESETVYVLLYSRDNGKSWLNMLDDSKATPGKIPWIEGTGPDPAKTLDDAAVGSAESWTWNTPANLFPKGSYAIRLEAHRRSESSHYSMHQEKIYVDR